MRKDKEVEITKSFASFQANAHLVNNFAEINRFQNEITRALNRKNNLEQKKRQH